MARGVHSVVCTCSSVNCLLFDMFFQFKGQDSFLKSSTKNSICRICSCASPGWFAGIRTTVNMFMGHGCCASPGSQFAGIRNLAELFPSVSFSIPCQPCVRRGQGTFLLPLLAVAEWRGWEGQPGPGGTQCAMISRLWF